MGFWVRRHICVPGWMFPIGTKLGLMVWGPEWGPRVGVHRWDVGFRV